MPLSLTSLPATLASASRSPSSPDPVRLRRALLGGALAGVLALAGCRGKTLSGLHGIPLEDERIGRDMALTDTEGQRRTLADFQGMTTAIFFGFTQCPDVCPTALQRALDAQALLGDDGKRVRVVFVTVDPERDTPEVLRAYLDAFDPAFVGLSGSEEETREAARSFKAFYAKVPTGSSYTMDHTALTYVYDASGQLRVAVRDAQTAQQFADDLRQVIALG